MKKTFSIITALLALVLSVRSDAQNNTDKDKSLLWRITGKQMSKPSFLFGTMHLICREDYLWTEKMKESLNKSDQVCFEMNLSDPNLMTETSMALMQTMLTKMQGSASGDEMKMLESFLKDSTLKDMDLSGKTNQMGLNSMAGMAGMNCKDPVSYEDSIMKLAQNDHKTIMGLESPAEQVDVISTMPLDSLFSMVMSGKMIDMNDAESKELVTAYKNQDLPALYKMIAGSKEQGMDMELFLDKRNIKWTPRMSDMMKVSSVFFAVGAGHLYGPNGVITLLRKDGYKVEAIK